MECRISVTFGDEIFALVPSVLIIFQSSISSLCKCRCFFSDFLVGCDACNAQLTKTLRANVMERRGVIAK